jgi:putative transcription antitermination factor YqgF
MLAIDYGTKYTGLAILREGFISSKPALLSIDVNFFEKLCSLITNNAIQTVVLGYAPPPDGRISRVHHEIKNLEKKLKHKYPDIPVYLIDETGTSNEAMEKIYSEKTGISRGRKKKKYDLKIHSVAACIILQRFLATIE